MPVDLSDEIRADLLRRRLESARKALQVVADGPPSDVTFEEWGHWCCVWAKDELNALETIKARKP